MQGNHSMGIYRLSDNFAAPGRNAIVEVAP